MQVYVLAEYSRINSWQNHEQQAHRLEPTVALFSPRKLVHEQGWSAMKI